MPAYFRPDRLSDALTALQRDPHLCLAGGTDIYPADAQHRAWGRPGLGNSGALPILDLSALTELRTIEPFDDRVEIGAGVTWTQILQAELPPGFDGLRAAAAEVGGRQIQNRGTLAGNLCNASPAADGVPPLLALDAKVRIASNSSVRDVELAQFIVGNRRTDLQAGELVTAVVIPRPVRAMRSCFLKLGARRYLVISIAMVAVNITLNDGVITDVRVAVGACSEVARRLRALESALGGVPCDRAVAAVRPDHFRDLHPLTDLRASAEYRREVARTLTKRALSQLAAADHA